MSDWILARLMPHNRIEWFVGFLALTLEFIYNKKKYFESKTKNVEIGFEKMQSLVREKWRV